MIVPPFAEEMNKSRRMCAEVAHGLAERGVASVLPDLYGTGDSAGEFADADWQVWQDDLLRVAEWMAQCGWPVTDLLCVRLGCALGAQVAGRLPSPVGRTVFWQPVADGARFVTQFLRLRVAASMMEDRRETVESLKARLQSGERIEVAGYELSGGLAGQLETVRLEETLDGAVGELHWMEVVREEGAPLPAASTRLLESIGQRLPSVSTYAVCGEPFWSSTEIVRLPELVSRTVDVLAPAA
jgi:hydrolase, ortholog 2, exosortase system type 1 associated